MSEERTMIDWFDEVYTICKDIPLDRLRELADAEREGRVAIRPDCAVCKLRIATEGHPNCGYEQSCSGKKRASFFEPLAAADAGNATEPKGERHA